MATPHYCVIGTNFNYPVGDPHRVFFCKGERNAFFNDEPLCTPFKDTAEEVCQRNEDLGVPNVRFTVCAVELP